METETPVRAGGYLSVHLDGHAGAYETNTVTYTIVFVA